MSRLFNLSVILASTALIASACGSGSDATSDQTGAQSQSSSVSATDNSSESDASPDTSSEAGDSGTSSDSANSDETGETIRIGWMNAFTGPFAIYGEDATLGAELAIDAVNDNGGIDGKKLELVKRDTKANVDEAIRIMQDFAADGIKIVGGVLLSPACAAIDTIAQENDMVVFSTHCADISLTTTAFSPNRFLIANSTQMGPRAAAKYASTRSDIASWNGLFMDYDTGHSYWEGFAENLATQTDSSKVGEPVYAAMDITKWGPIVQRLLALGSDDGSRALIASTFPANWQGFVKDAAPFNLFQKYSTLVSIGGYERIMEAIGATAPEIVNVYSYFYSAFDNPTNDAFRKAFLEQDQSGAKGPNAVHELGYATINAISKAIEVGGTSADAIISGMTNTPFDSPAGSVYFREDHQLAAPVAIFTCSGDQGSDLGYSCDESSASFVAAEDAMPPVNIG